MENKIEFLSLLDAPDPCFDESPCICLTLNEWAIKAPDVLYENSLKLKQVWAAKNNLVALEDFCDGKDLKEVINAVAKSKNVDPKHYVVFVKLCNRLEIDEKFLGRFMPLYEISGNRLAGFSHILFCLTRTRYVNLVKEILNKQIGIKLKEEYIQNYITFHRVIKYGYWKPRYDFK